MTDATPDATPDATADATANLTADSTPDSTPDSLADEARDLLAKAAETTGAPSFDAGTVFAKAARIRRRRRRTFLAGAALTAATVGALLTLPDGTPAQTTAAPPAPTHTRLTGGSGREEKLAELLPAGTGRVAEVSLPLLLKNADLDAVAPDGPEGGPLDGGYAIHRDGGVGYLTISVRDGASLDAKLPDARLCTPADTDPAHRDCVRERTSGGGTLTIWRQPEDPEQESTPTWGEELKGVLTLPDGRTLLVRDSTGYRGENALGPMLPTPPLAREQLRALMLRPELVTPK
ncbi:hypothetical protein [Streptomyces flavalbus]|uniref:Uncharacterized protein n=1 Tax=Streptomyces flavalbus TaxID=2665155 RepID=A0ABW2W912_9ACTN